MKKLAVLSAAALIGVGALTSSAAEARGGGALAAGIIGGLAAGALLGAAVSDAHAAPRYGYAPPPPAYGYGPAPVVGSYGYEVPAYETRRVVSYRPVFSGYDDRPIRHPWHGDWDRPYGYRGW